MTEHEGYHTCLICDGIQDSKHFENYNICTMCFDIMEDVMSEYFLRTIRYSKPTSEKSYSVYLDYNVKYASDYKKIREHTKRHLNNIETSAKHEIEQGAKGTRLKYFERFVKVIEWIRNTPEFYNYYFKDYYVCPECGTSIFKDFENDMVGDWMLISCGKCGNTIKKYYLPKSI